MAQRLLALAASRAAAEVAWRQARPACLAAAAWSPTQPLLSYGQPRATSFASQAAFAVAVRTIQSPSLQHLKWHCLPNPNDRTPQPQRVHATFAQAQEPLPSIDVPVRDLGNFEWENPRVPPPPLEFDNAEAAFAAHSSLSIMRSLAVFSLCSIRVGGSRRTRLHVQLLSSLQARSWVHLTLHVQVTVGQICPWKITK